MSFCNRPQVNLSQLQFEDGKMIKASRYGQAEENITVEFTAEEQEMVEAVRVRPFLPSMGLNGQRKKEGLELRISSEESACQIFHIVFMNFKI